MEALSARLEALSLPQEKLFGRGRGLVKVRFVDLAESEYDSAISSGASLGKAWKVLALRGKPELSLLERSDNGKIRLVVTDSADGSAVPSLLVNHVVAPWTAIAVGLASPDREYMFPADDFSSDCGGSLRLRYFLLSFESQPAMESFRRKHEEAVRRMVGLGHRTSRRLSPSSSPLSSTLLRSLLVPHSTHDPAAPRRSPNALATRTCDRRI